MVARARTLPARLAPPGGLDALRQVALFAGVYCAYAAVRAAVAAHPAAAFEHAREVVHAERALHLFVEPALQGWASARVLQDAAAWLYVNAQTTVTVGALVWLYLRRRHAYGMVRDGLLIAMGLALVGYAAFPTAPPRLLPGFTDPVAHMAGGPVGGALVNPYAAIPSMHVAFALLIALPVARQVRSRALRALWLGYPPLMAFVVLVTANHFVLDVALGAVTAALAAGAARRVRRTRAVLVPRPEAAG